MPLKQWGGKLLTETWALHLGGFSSSPVGSWTHYPPLAVPDCSKPTESSSLEEVLKGRVRVGCPHVLRAREGPFAPSRAAGPGTQAGVTGSSRWQCGWKPLACGNPVFISSETHALLQRRLQDARTMKPFAEVFRVADSGLGLLGGEPAVCVGAFPIAAHLERPAQKNGEERRPPSRLTHISGAEAQGAVTLRGQEWM